MGVATAISLFSAIVGAAASAKQGRDAKKQARAQEDVTRAEAKSAREVAEATERDFRRRQSQSLGELMAARGTAGTESGTGSSLLAAGDFDAETELQAMRIRKGGEMQATRLEQQADLYRRAGQSAQRRGYARSGASLLSGVSEAYK